VRVPSNCLNTNAPESAPMPCVRVYLSAQRQQSASSSLSRWTAKLPGQTTRVRLRSGREADAHVVAEPSEVEERHDSGAKTEVGVIRVVDEYTIASSEGVPLELQHHADRCLGPSNL
jgi:hypothetical protein